MDMHECPKMDVYIVGVQSYTFTKEAWVPVKARLVLVRQGDSKTKGKEE